MAGWIPFTRTLLLWCLGLPATALAAPLFDAHLHYNQSQRSSVSLEDVVSSLTRNDVRHALVTSRPPQLVQQLYQQAPDRVLPMLGVYQTLEDKESWYMDRQLPERVEADLKSGHWMALGELHLFAEHRHRPVFHALVQLAVTYRLPLMIHGDPAVIDTLYEMAPGHPVIWAHAGTFPYPDLLADYLGRYPALHVDVSVRDGRIAPAGVLSDDWYQLLILHPDRFMVGVDTFSPGRWQDYDQVAAGIRHWLSQLPPDVAQNIAFENANRVLRGSRTD
ncbi:MAG: TatD family hydrolase [Gammaproteobacteria bacterium]|nr:TatD family hydrolase [Gammaproteobacteria bacterium]